MKHTSEEIKYRLSDLGAQIGNIAIEYITELEKENAELKTFKEKCKFKVSDIFKEIETENKLTEATEIIKFLINPQLLDKPQYYEWRLKAEKFIKEN